MEYTMAQITHLTEIQPHTLRAWEKRYNYVVANRRSSKFRFYTEQQLRKLLNTSVLLKQGLRISQIAKLSEKEFNDAVKQAFEQNSVDITSKQKALILAMLEFDEVTFHSIYDASIRKEGTIKTFSELIYPFLAIVGEMWRYGKALPVQEHFITNLITNKLVKATEELNAPEFDAPTLILFLLEGESHEIGLRLANFLARKSGWKTIYLGSRVPVENLEGVMEASHSSTLLSSFIIPNPSQLDILSQFLTKNPNVKLFCIGNPSNFSKIIKYDQADYLDHPSALTSYLSMAS